MSLHILNHLENSILQYYKAAEIKGCLRLHVIVYTEAKPNPFTDRISKVDK